MPPRFQNSDELPVTTEISDSKASFLKLTLSEGMLIAAATASAYLWTFQYERGFASHFGIPSQFINVGLVNVLLLAGLAAGLLFSAVMIMNSLVTLVFPTISRHPLLIRHATTMLIVLPATYVVAFLYGTWWWLLLATLTTAFIGFFLFVRPVFRKEESYLRKLEAQAKSDQNGASVSLFKLASRKLGPNLPLAIWMLLYSFLVAQWAGDAAATNQKEFLVTTASSSQEMVLLRTYNDELIFAPFDRKTKEVQKSFVMVRVQDLKTALTVEEVGPLNAVKPQAVPPLAVASPSPQASATPVPTVTPKATSGNN